MALAKSINYYIDDDGYYRRIPWDSWVLDGEFVGFSPVGLKNQDTLEIDSNGVVSCFLDFIDVGVDEEIEKEITGINVHDSERSFLEDYENVFGFYESDFSQTYEFDFDKPEFKE